MMINASDQEEYRIAIVEDGWLEEYYTDSSTKEQIRGNIYKAVIVNIEPSLQAAFVDCGLERNGFLQINDVHPEYYQKEWLESRLPDIKTVLTKGQSVLVQVTKEGAGTKGPALTTFVSIAGQYAVISPGRPSIGVSRKIEDEAERQRLKEAIQELPNLEEFGIIVRTAAVGRNKKDITRDLSHHLRLWEGIRKSVPDLPTPSLVYKEQDLAIRTIRDHFTPEIEEILIDDEEVYNKALEYMKVVSPRYQTRLKRFKEKRPIFSRHQIEEQLQTIFESEVRLKSGGSIVINQTEALVAIDVNSGRGTRGSSMEDTAFRTNTEAAQEISRQLRLRDLGGLIVIDFIDMRDKGHTRDVEKTLKTETKKDRAKIDLGRISKFGLLELSRQRLGMPIEFGTFRTCQACGGKGVVRSTEATALAVLRDITQRASKGVIERVGGRLHSAVADYLLNQKRGDLLDIEGRFGIEIHLEGNAGTPPGQIDLEYVRRASETEEAEPAAEV
jgi:ribonuclease E